MKNIFRLSASISLLLLGIGWLALAEFIWLVAPVALASEAPYRYIKNKDDIKQEHFVLCFGLADEIRKRNVHPFFASIPLVLGTILYLKNRKTPQPGAAANSHP